MFQVALAKLVAITGPYTKAIQCLESAHTTCTDIYLYWLAIVTQMEQLLQAIQFDCGKRPNWPFAQLQMRSSIR